MTYTFTGRPEDVMSAIVRNAKAAAQDHLNAEGHLRDALIGLVGLHQQQAEYGPVDACAMRHFRRESGAAFTKVPTGVRMFSWHMSDLAESGQEGDWYFVAMRRSALQPRWRHLPGQG